MWWYTNLSIREHKKIKPTSYWQPLTLNVSCAQPYNEENGMLSWILSISGVLYMCPTVYHIHSEHEVFPWLQTFISRRIFRYKHVLLFFFFKFYFTSKSSVLKKDTKKDNLFVHFSIFAPRVAWRTSKQYLISVPCVLWSLFSYTC